MDSIKLRIIHGAQLDRKHMLVRYQVSEPWPDKKGGEARRHQPLVKRKIMSLLSHYPDEAQHI